MTAVSQASSSCQKNDLLLGGKWSSELASMIVPGGVEEATAQRLTD